MRNTLLFLMLLYAGIGNASDELIQTSPCPGLVSSYDVKKFEQVLVITDDDFSSIEDCEQLGGFFFGQSGNKNNSLNYANLATIVDTIWQPVNEEAPLLLLEAILSWMKGLGLDGQAESFRDFINEYLPAEESVQLFFTIVLWLLVIAAVILVLHEFYRAGMLKLPRRRDEADVDRQEIRSALQWETVLTLPLRQQISALLQYSIERLVAENLIPSSSSFTNHELAAYLENSDAHKASLLREQINLTEPVVYGDATVTENEVIACRVKAEGLSDA